MNKNGIAILFYYAGLQLSMKTKISLTTKTPGFSPGSQAQPFVRFV